MSKPVPSPPDALPSPPDAHAVAGECCDFCNPSHIVDYETECVATTIYHGRKAFICRDCLASFVGTIAVTRRRRRPNPPGQMSHARFAELRAQAARWRQEWQLSPGIYVSKFEASEALHEALDELSRILSPYIELP